MKWPLWILPFCVVLLGTAAELSAQDGTEKLESFELQGEDLVEAILKLSQESGVNIAFSNSSLPEVPAVYYTAQNKSPIEILHDILSGQGFDIKKLQSGIAIVLREELLNSHVISGYIRDADTGERLVNAHVVDLNSQSEVFSNEFGFFSMRIKGGPRSLVFSYLGYGDSEREFLLTSDQFILVDLSPSVLLEEVTIYGNEYWKLWEQSTNVRNIPVQELKSLPSLGGTADPIRFTHSISGVQTSADGIGGINVRGANIQHNLFLLDGVKVYNPSHVNGLFSIFNDQFVNTSRFYKTPGPARFSGALASVLDVRTKDGNKNQLSGELDVDLTNASITLDGPFKKEKSSFLISGRYSYLDELIRGVDQRRRANENQGGGIDYEYYDILIKNNFQINDKTDIYFSFYKGKDLYDSTTDELFTGSDNQIFSSESMQFDWGNTVASARLNRSLSNNVFLKLTAFYTEYHQNFSRNRLIEESELNGTEPFSIVERGLAGTSRLQDIGGAIDLDVVWSPRYSLRSGLQYIHHEFQPGLSVRQSLGKPLDPEDNIELEKRAEPYDLDEISFYVENELHVFPSLELNLGLNSSVYSLERDKDIQLNPRLSALWRISENIHFSGFSGRSTQFFHLLQTSSFGLPSDPWVPLTEEIGPQRQWLHSAAFKFFLSNNQLSLGVYTKRLHDLLNFQEGTLTGIETIVNISEWEDIVVNGSGQARGFELEWMRSSPKLDWSLSYTLSESTRQFDEINLGRTFRDDYDRPHKISLDVIYRLTPAWECSLSGTWMSGSPLTFPVGEQVVVDPETGTVIRIPIIEERNGFELPDYFRLDVAARYTFGNSKWKQALHFGVFNATNHRNPLFYRYVAVQDQEIIFLQARLLPISPSIRYSLSF